MILTFAPIRIWPEGWVRGQESKSWSPFKANFRSTLELLDRELGMLNASHVQLQLDITERQLRLDGGLKDGSIVGYHGCILSFETSALGTLTYSCNEFEITNPRNDSWKENLRAIALGLEALRRVERYGIANRGQQYAGWAELPSGIALGAVMTAEEAAAFIAEHSVESPLSGRPVFTPAEVLADAEKRRSAFRLASRILHPDTGGDPELFRKLTAARDLLEAA